MIINAKGLFGTVIHLDSSATHEQSIEDLIQAWRSSHTALERVGLVFSNVVSEIECYLRSLGESRINIPYTTNIWLAQLC